MRYRTLLSATVAALLVATHAQAAVELVAAGSLDANQGDHAWQTARPLENGVAGNLLGGIGSGLAYGGCGTFLALPDRGPNATPYNDGVDDTVSYIPRFQSVHMTLDRNPGDAALPFRLTPRVQDTTLFWDAVGLVYGTGAAAGLPTGKPSLNHAFHHYFSGRSDNFDATHGSGWSLDARLDPEGIRASPDGRVVYVSDEYGPYVYKFDRRTGMRLDSYALPAMFDVAMVAPTGDAEIAGNGSGRVANKGMEGLALTPDGRTLVGAMQAPLIQDGGAGAQTIRLVRIDLRTREVQQYAYALTNHGSAKKPKFGGVSEIVAVNDHQFLVDERDGKGFGDGSEAAFKHVYLIDLDHAQEVSRISGSDALAAAAVSKTDFLDIVASLGAHGIAPSEVPSKIEGLAFGPDIRQDGHARHTLFIANDNDFLPHVTDDLHPQGADNPNRFFVFAFDDADLPGYQPERFRGMFCPRR